MRVISIAMVLGVVLVSPPLHAALHVRGTDALEYRLIYDDDLNLTWYDYSNVGMASSWYYQIGWADALTVTIGGVTYDDWRLPTIVMQETPPLHSFSGTTTYGFNISWSEMGHLYHAELGNLSYYDTNANYQPAYGLANKGPFLNLQPIRYYDNVTYPLNGYAAGHFEFGTGEQYVTAKEALGGTNTYGIAVRRGDVVPEPACFSIVLVGLLSVRRQTHWGR